jgi:hypothetical protein
LRFRAAGTVEFWNPQTGTVTPAGVVRSEAGTSVVALELPPSGSVFVVFRKDGQTAPKQIVQVERDGVTVADAHAPRRVVSGPQVISASYGDPTNPDRRLDVTEAVRRELEHGNAIKATNAWAGGDPAKQTVKRVFVVMRLPDGREKRIEGAENEPLTLLDPAGAARTTCEPLDGDRLLAWEPGVWRATLADGTTRTWETRVPRSIPLDGHWTLTFPAGWGAPETLRVDKLASWTELPLPAEAQAFSGTATYTTEFDLDPLAAGMKAELDLGRVEAIASVRLNNEAVGTLWTAPYRLDITRLVKSGANTLSVSVTNTWFNRLAYDAGLPESQRKTWTIKGPSKGTALKPTGLLGPVTITVQ